MATQWTAGTTSGQVLTAATLNTIGAAWESWTLAWTSSGVAPAIGNGVTFSTYCRINKLVVASGILYMGSTTTYGTGTYRFSLPIAAVSSSAVMGYATLLDSSAGFVNYTGLGIQVTTSTIEYRLGNAQGIFSPTVPVTLANGDQLRFTCVYEAA